MMHCGKLLCLLDCICCHLLRMVQVPAGSLPRTMEVILRNDVVEHARAGDETNFTGTLLVVPDVAAISAPGDKVQTRPGLCINMCPDTLRMVA